MAWIGGLLLGGGITAIVYAVGEGSQWGWGSAEFAAYIAGVLITLAAFVLVERRVADPLFPPSMTRRRPVWTVLLATSVAAGSLSAVGVVMQMLVLMPKITDGAEHSRWRRMLTSSFTRHRMEKLRPAIQQITDDLIDKLLARRAVVEDIEIDGETIRAGLRASSRPCRPPTGIRWRSPSPRSSTSPVGRRTMSRSAGAHTSASGNSWPVSNSTSCSARCSVGVPTWRLVVDVSGSLKFKEDQQAYGIYELPVTWELLEVREAADTTRPSPHRREDGLRPAVKLVGTTGFEPATP